MIEIIVRLVINHVSSPLARKLHHSEDTVFLFTLLFPTYNKSLISIYCIDESIYIDIKYVMLFLYF